MEYTMHIYALIDPTTKRVRYVGRAVNVRSRYIAHIHTSLRGDCSPRDIWIETLVDKGLWPLVAVVDSVQGESFDDALSKAKDAERRWIKFYAEQEGWLLLNASGAHDFRNGKLMRTVCKLHRLHRLAGERGDERALSESSLAIDFLYKHDRRLRINERPKKSSRYRSWPPTMARDYQEAAKRRNACFGRISKAYDDSRTEIGACQESSGSICESAGEKG